MRGGGSAEVIEKLARHFSADMIVTICTLESKSINLPNNVHIEVLKIIKPPIFTSLLTYIQILIRLRQTILRVNPTKIVSFIHIANIICIFAAWKTSGRVIVCERSDILKSKIGRVWKCIRPIVYWRADTICLQNQMDRNLLPNYLQRKIIIARNPIKEPVFAELGSPRLIAIGRLHPVKRFDLLIRLCSQILKSNPQLELHIFGDGPERPYLETIIRDLELTNQAILRGITYDIQAAISECSIFLMTSASEGQPNALLEALASGLPAICLDTSSCFHEIKAFFPHLHLIPPGQEDFFIDTLTKILKRGIVKYPSNWEQWNSSAWSDWHNIIKQNQANTHAT